MQMYVLSSMAANKQSMAGSLLQTLTRLTSAVGYGIATAIFDAVQAKPSSSGYYAGNAAEPYAAVFWFATGGAFLGVLFVPWLKIGTQGHVGDKGRAAERGMEEKENAGADEGENSVVGSESRMERGEV
jgi:hypothetical protein